MKPIYDQAVRAEIRHRMSPPNRESVAKIARDTGITTQTLYNWRSQWQKEGPLVPARSPREPRPDPVLEATGICQVLDWDITLLPGHDKVQFFYLYMVMDVWSRRILGVEVHERECSVLASALFDRVCRDEGISKETAAVLHSDNGAPMRSYTLAAKMTELGVTLVLQATCEQRQRLR